MVEELRHVVLAPAVVPGEGVVRHVAHDERVAADPHAVVVRIHHDVVPAVVVRIVDEDGPCFRRERAALEILPPALPRPHVLAHVRLDVAWNLRLRR